MCCKSWKASTAWTCRCTQTEDQMVGSPRRTNTKDNNLEPNSNYYILDHISTVLAFCTPCSAPEPESSYLPESLRRHPTSPQKPTNKPELRILSWLFSSRIKRCISAMPWHVLQQCDAWPNSPVLKGDMGLGRADFSRRPILTILSFSRFEKLQLDVLKKRAGVRLLPGLRSCSPKCFHVFPFMLGCVSWIKGLRYSPRVG